MCSDLIIVFSKPASWLVPKMLEPPTLCWFKIVLVVQRVVRCWFCHKTTKMLRVEYLFSQHNSYFTKRTHKWTQISFNYGRYSICIISTLVYYLIVSFWSNFSIHIVHLILIHDITYIYHIILHMWCIIFHTTFLFTILSTIS